MKLNIQNPCTENWEQMNPAQKGRFCASCEKEVVDFRNMSDTEIKQYFQNAVGKTCGRFHEDQLGRALVSTKPANSWNFAKFWLGLTLLVSYVGKAESPPNKIEIRSAQNANLPAQPTEKEESDSTFVIAGIVIHHHSKKPLMVILHLENGRHETLATVSTRGTGKFSMNIPTEKIEKAMFLAVEQEGVIVERFSISPDKKKGTFSTKLKVKKTIDELPLRPEFMGDVAPERD